MLEPSVRDLKPVTLFDERTRHNIERPHALVCTDGRGRERAGDQCCEQRTDEAEFFHHVLIGGSSEISPSINSKRASLPKNPAPPLCADPSASIHRFARSPGLPFPFLLRSYSFFRPRL